MIYNQWYIILESKELKSKRPLRIRRLNENLVVWRDAVNKVACIADRCAHRGASLSCGKIINGNLECPFHGFIYNNEGQVILIPANGKSAPVPKTMKVRAYSTFEKNGFIWLWWGDEEQITAEPFFFTDLDQFSFSTFIDPWKVHYSRAIENQLDVVHLPFVHKTTIGAGNKTVVNGPVVKRDNDLITFYVNNVTDEGATLALHPDEIKDYEKLFHLKFHFPNVWQNYISDKVRVLAAFVPVDEDNTLVYIRFYQRFVKLPILRSIVNYLAKLSNIVILRQDKRIVVTQLPKKSELMMNEKLIVGDLPIVEYRRHRQKLKEQNNPIPD